MNKYATSLLVAGFVFAGCSSKPADGESGSLAETPAAEANTAALAPIEKDGLEEEDEIDGAIPPVDTTKKGVFDPGHVKMRIRFKKDAVDVREKMPKLDRIVAFMKSNADYALVVRGHTDASGDSEADMKTSRQRAKAVAKYLKQAGVEPTRIQVDALGASTPIADNGTKKGRNKNRRVDFALVASN